MRRAGFLLFTGLVAVAIARDMRAYARERLVAAFHAQLDRVTGYPIAWGSRP